MSESRESAGYSLFPWRDGRGRGAVLFSTYSQMLLLCTMTPSVRDGQSFPLPSLSLLCALLNLAPFLLIFFLGHIH